MPRALPNATLEQRLDLTEDLAVFQFRPDPGAELSFEPGQFTRLGLAVAESWERALLRAYSIASAPDPATPLEFYVARVAGGAFTSRLWELGPGARAWLEDRAHGHFTLAGVPREADLVLAATGTGIAPYLSMLRHHQGQGRWRRLALLHCVRVEAELGYRAELERRAREDASFAYLPTLTREPAESGWQGLRGRLQTVLLTGALRELGGIELDPTRAHVFLCGNPEMIRDLGAELAARGFAPHRTRTAGRLHVERFW